MKHGAQIKYLVGCLTIIFLFCCQNGITQTPESNDIKTLVQSFKRDERGPYQAIRWFCPDGSILPPDQRCPQPGGIQHALPRDVVQDIARHQEIYLGQILAGTGYQEFWDESNRQSRLKQYQMEKYLRAADDGWILRRARFYRGAIQIEDEARWSLEFLKWALGENDRVAANFFLLRQAVKDLPHKTEDNRWETIRALSKTIADSLPIFMDMRVKLHGQPDPGDLQRVRDFRTRNRSKISAEIEAKLLVLEDELEAAYRPTGMETLNDYWAKLPADSPVADQLKKILRTSPPAALTPEQRRLMEFRRRCDIAGLIWSIRRNLLTVKSAKARRIMVDLSVELENILFRNNARWEPQTIGELLQKNYALVKAAAGCGLLELWEWEKIEPLLSVPSDDADIPLEKFVEKVNYSRRAAEWGSAMIRTVYEPVVRMYSAFEPLAGGFIDDRIRSSILLPLGNIAGELAGLASDYTGVFGKVMDLKNQQQIYGLNPGFAVGELEVITGPPEGIEFAADKIYMLLRAPSDLKPVAGIATVSEGNPVSHVQLLARNLGIPNAVISLQNLTDLALFSGERVFYAVSPRGTVVMKPESQMTPEERSLVEVRRRSEERIVAPVDKINLSRRELVNLTELRASDSGKLCGPKAANLGQLKRFFPHRVVDGIVIPFGIFRQHLNQIMPGQEVSYWDFLQDIFTRAAFERKSGKSEKAVEEAVLLRLAELRDAIKQIPFRLDFEQTLGQMFIKVFGSQIGGQAVFIRSDTNMEDLKDFTGAGLNLTIFNVLEKEQIFQGIRDVWASPYTERSYRWRQKYLLNPENVYPSILIIPTVNVDKSGVMITTGIVSAEPRDITVAFNRGAGGAVEGQAAETYLLRRDGQNLLLSPSREPAYTVVPETGGSEKKFTDFSRPILSPGNLKRLREVAEEIRDRLPGSPGIETEGPFDVELGFKDGEIWLFQVRPFVENKRAKFSAYLQTLDMELPKDIQVFMGKKL